MTFLLIITLLSSLTVIAIFVVTRNRTTGIEPKKLFEILKEWGEAETAFNNDMMQNMADLRKLMKSVFEVLKKRGEDETAFNNDMMQSMADLIKSMKSVFEFLKERGEDETAFNDGMMNRMTYLEKLIKSMSGEIDSISKHNLDLVVSVIAVNGHIKTSKERWNYLCDKIGQPELKYNEEDQTNKTLSLEPFDYSGVGSDIDIRDVCGVKGDFFNGITDVYKGKLSDLVKYVEQNSTTANELAFGMYMAGKLAQYNDSLTSKHEQYE